MTAYKYICGISAVRSKELSIEIPSYKTHITDKEYADISSMKLNNDVFSVMLKRAGLNNPYACGLNCKGGAASFNLSDTTIVSRIQQVMQEIESAEIGKVVRLEYAVVPENNRMLGGHIDYFACHAILFDIEEDFLLFRLMFPHLVNVKAVKHN